MTQVIHSLSARDEAGVRLSSYRTDHGAVVDLIIERGDDLIAIEVKASRNVGKGDLSGLRSFAGYVGKKHRAVIAYLGEHRQDLAGVEVLPWQDLLRFLDL